MKNKYLLFVLLIIVLSSFGFAVCTQNLATEIVSGCGLNTGSYSFSDNANDGDVNTCDIGTYFTPTIKYINYTIPSGIDFLNLTLSQAYYDTYTADVVLPLSSIWNEIETLQIKLEYLGAGGRCSEKCIVVSAYDEGDNQWVELYFDDSQAGADYAPQTCEVYVEWDYDGVSSAPLVNPFYVVSSKNLNTTGEPIYCNFTLSNTNTSFFNWYENNVTATILNMPMEINQSTALKDYSDNFNNFIFSNTSSALFYNATGGRHNGGAFEFLGSGTSSLYLNNTVGINNLTEYTSTIWYKPRSNNLYMAQNDFQRLALFGENGVSYYQIATQRTTNMIYCRNQHNATAGYNTEYHANFSNIAGTWIHIGCVYNASHLSIYINGTLMNTTANPYYPYNTKIMTTTSNSVIGNILNLGGTRITNGTIDEVMVYKHAVTPKQMENFYLENNELSNPILNTKYKCSVYAYNSTYISDETYSLNEINVSTYYYKPIVSVIYPTDTYHYYNFNGNITLNVNASIDYSCNINDTRFEKINNLLFSNTTLNDQRINIKINCSDAIDSTSTEFYFVIDTTTPFINFNYPTSENTYAHNVSYSVTLYDNYLYLSNITLRNSTGSYVYVNESALTPLTNTTISETILGLPDDKYNLEVCVADSLQNSPTIKDDTKTLITKDDNVVRNVIEYNKVKVLKEIFLYDNKDKQLKIKDVNLEYFNEWDLSGKHLKYMWNVDKTKLKQDDYFKLTLSCQDNSCQKMIYLNDRNKNRIIDNTAKVYFTFDDLIANGFSVEYKQNGNSVDVLIKMTPLVYASKSSVINYDPIVAGLQTNCRNVNITVDNTLPFAVTTPTIASNKSVVTSYLYNSYGSDNFNCGSLKFHVVINNIDYNSGWVSINSNTGMGTYSQEGTHIIYTEALDCANNYYITPKVYMYVDNTDPIITINNYYDKTNKTYYNIDYSVTESNLNFSRLYLYDNNSNLISSDDYYTNNVNVQINVSNGDYSFRVMAKDILNHVSYSSVYNFSVKTNMTETDLTNNKENTDNVTTVCQEINIMLNVSEELEDLSSILLKYKCSGYAGGCTSGYLNFYCPFGRREVKTGNMFIRLDSTSINDFCYYYSVIENKTMLNKTTSTLINSCIPMNITFTIELNDSYGHSTESNTTILIIPKLNGTIEFTPSNDSRIDNDINVDSSSDINFTTNMTTNLYRYFGNQWILYSSKTINGNVSNVTFNNLIDGKYKYDVIATDKYGDTHKVASDTFIIRLEKAIYERMDSLTFEQIMGFVFMAIIWLGVLIVGLMFKNNVLQMFGAILGILFGIILTINLHWSIGLMMILTNTLLMIVFVKK